MKHLNVGGPLVTMAPRKSMTSVSGGSGEPNGRVISLTIGFARTTIISLPTIHYPLYICLVMFYIVLSKAVLHCMILLTAILYYILL